MSSSEREVLRLAQPPLRRFLPGAALGTLSALSSVALLATSAWLITRASQHPPILFLSAAIVGVRAFALGRAAFRYAERLAGHDAALRRLGALRVGIYRRLEPLAPDLLPVASTGDLMTRLVSDVDRMPDLPLRVVQPLVVAAVTAMLSVIGVTVLLPAAGIALALALALGFVVSTLVHSAISAAAERQSAPLLAALAGRVLDTIAELDVLTAFDALDDRLRSIDEADGRLTRASLRRAAGAGTTTALLGALAGFAAIAGLASAVPALTSGSLDAPALAVVALVPLAVFESLGTAPLAVAAWRQVRASAQRIADTTTAEWTVPPRGGSAPAPSALGASAPVIALHDFSVRWPGAPDDTITALDLELSPGDRLHISGASGAGKTTLAHALVGFLAHRGSYRLRGVEVDTLSEDALRSVVGLCEQTPYLFDSDLRQNLLLARDTATDDDLLEVLRRVGLFDWAMDRDGLDTRVGDGGGLVSGGQAQRIALARALLADFAVVVFDEPTANVEEGLADRLMADILTAASDDRRIVVVISHTAVDPSLVTRSMRLEPTGRRVASR